MGASVFFALRDAIETANFEQRKAGDFMCFNSPATVENIRMSVNDKLSKVAQEAAGNSDKPWCVRP